MFLMWKKRWFCFYAKKLRGVITMYLNVARKIDTIHINIKTTIENLDSMFLSILN